MAEYIKKDELFKFKTDVYDEDGHVLYAVPTGYIVAMTPADVAPVRHGRWNVEYPTGSDFWRCSACKTLRNLDWHYCPNCGSKMDGGAVDAAD